MVQLKTPVEIKIMQTAGEKLRMVMEELLPLVKPGVTTNFVNQEAERLIAHHGGETSFGKVKNYHWATCLPVNEQAVHTPPSDRVLKDGDLLTIDIGLFYKGFHTDHAVSLEVGGPKNPDITRFLEATRSTLSKALKKVQNGAYVGEISAVIQEEIYKNGYFVLKELTGHGIGRDLHEDPYVMQYRDQPIKETYKMRPGLVLAVEIIPSMGTEHIEFEEGSDWSIVTADGSLACCFEHTIALTDGGPVLIT